jgi:hypothetical protein
LQSGRHNHAVVIIHELRSSLWPENIFQAVTIWVVFSTTTELRNDVQGMRLLFCQSAEPVICIRL